MSKCLGENVTGVACEHHLCTPFAALHSCTLLAHKGEGGEHGWCVWKQRGWHVEMGGGAQEDAPTSDTIHETCCLHIILLCLYYYIYSMEIKYQRQKKIEGSGV